MFVSSIFLVAATFSVPALGAVADTAGTLLATPDSAQRVNLLQDKDFVFDFLHATTGVTTGAGGHTVAAEAGNFPAVIGNSMSMTVGFLGPCGLNTPHIHPRATEFNYIVNGTIITGLLSENGARFITNTIHGGQSTIFNKGAIHFEFNDGCDDALFVAAFNDVNPGVVQVAQRYLGLPPSVVGASLGGLGVEKVAGLEALIPDNIALGLQECLDRCGLKRTGQPTLQRQPRVSGNALPTGYSAPSASSPTSIAGTSTPSAVSNLAEDASNVNSNGSGSSSSKLLNPLTIALIAVVGVLTVGYIALGAFLFIRRRRERADRMNGRNYIQPGGGFAPHGTFDDDKQDTMPFQQFRPSREHIATTPYDPPASSL